jgi:hypothetical protein
MKKIELVFNQLSQLYEFNKKLQTFKIKSNERIKEQQIDKTDRK